MMWFRKRYGDSHGTVPQETTMLPCEVENGLPRDAARSASAFSCTDAGAKSRQTTDADLGVIASSEGSSPVATVLDEALEAGINTDFSKCPSELTRYNQSVPDQTGLQTDGQNSISPSSQEPSRLDAVATALDEVSRKVSELAGKQEDLNRLFESRLQSDEVQAKAVERLHDQIQDYKNNFIRKAIVSVLKDVIHCCDFVAGELEGISASGDACTAPSLEHLKQMLLDVLFKHDIEPFRCEEDGFDRKTQQCVRTVPTVILKDDKKIATRGVIGFRDKDTVVRKEQVAIYKYAATGQ